MSSERLALNPNYVNPVKERIDRLRSGFAEEGEKFIINLCGRDLDEIEAIARILYGDIRIESQNVIDGFGKRFSTLDGSGSHGYAEGRIVAAVYRK